MSHGLHPHRPTAIAAGLLLLAAPVLSSCGFNAATDRINTISAGVNDRAGTVDVLGAVIIAGEDNAGLFVASLANNSTDSPDQLTAVSNSATALETPYVIPAGCGLSLFTPYVVPAAGDTRCADVPAPGGDTGSAELETIPAGIAVTGQFSAGDFVEMSLTFDSGQVSTLEVPVVVPCFAYSPDKFDPPLMLPTAGTDPAATESASAEASDTESTDEYSCTPVAPARPVIPQGDDEQGEGE